MGGQGAVETVVVLPRRYGFRRFARSGYKFFFEITGMITN